jgi:hypothetical protein
VSQFDCGRNQKCCYNSRVDWRIKTIFGVVAAAVVVTAAVYYWGYGRDPASFFGAVFAAWIGGLALFVITGILVAIISLARPEAESFDARARILFRRQAGKHIDYIISKIKEVLEHYAESTDIKITIREYSAAERKYLVSSTQDTIVRSYLDDVESTYISEIGISETTAPPPGGSPNRLVYARVGGTPVGATEAFNGTVIRPITCRIDRDGTCLVSTMTEFWLRANDEDNTHIPRRYTQVLRLHFENLIPADVEVKLTLDGTNWLTERMLPGTRRQVIEIKDLKPGATVFNYRITAT